MDQKNIILLVIFASYIATISSVAYNYKTVLKVINERLIVSDYNPKYISSSYAGLKKPNRTSPWLSDFNMTLTMPWYKNVSMRLTNAELFTNVYKPGIIYIEQNVCDSLHNPFYTTMRKNFSNLPADCPISGFIYAENVITAYDELPLIFHPSQHRYDFFVFRNDAKKTPILLVQAFIKYEYAYVRKNKVPNKKTQG